jgi:phosphoglucosamine mutase
MRSLFGTDGVRGRANTHPMTAEMALRLGAAAGRFFRHDRQNHRAVIGKDTRRSGYMLETALTAGLASTGMNVFLLGPVPTPAVGYLTRSMRADLGVMISASHNPHHDNGIKLFGPDGYKLSDAAEAEIEAILGGDIALARPENIGRVKRIDDGRGRYVEFAKTTLPRQMTFGGLKVVIDCAHGAAWRTAPEALFELGADVVALGVAPDGTNINAGCGSTDTALAARTVRETGADLGLCLDGDADRLIVLDETGAAADGDQIMALFARRLAAEGQLAHGTLVATVMSNLGLERALASDRLRLHRTPVGDRYVVEAMRAHGFNLGGEQSGHIVMADYGTTGDGLVAGLHFLAEMVRTGQPASALARQFEPLPQMLRSVRFRAGQHPLDAAPVRAAIRAAEAQLGERGRLVIRESGTEPVIRVMAEAEDGALMAATLSDVVTAVEAAI